MGKGVTALWHFHLLHSFSFSTIFGLNPCELRMHWKPKSKWLSNREGIDEQAHVEEFSSDDFQVEQLLGSCSSMFPGIQLGWVPPFLLQVFGSVDVETSFPSFLKVSECKLQMETDSDLLILIFA